MLFCFVSCFEFCYVSTKVLQIMFKARINRFPFTKTHSDLIHIINSIIQVHNIRDCLVLMIIMKLIIIILLANCFGFCRNTAERIQRIV